MQTSKAIQNQNKKPAIQAPSLRQYIEDADSEVVQERLILSQQLEERQKIASQLSNAEKDWIAQQTSDQQKAGEQILQMNHKKVFGKIVDGSTSKDRLEELLQKTEQYTKFILLQNQKNISKAEEKQKKQLSTKQTISKRRLAVEITEDRVKEDSEDEGKTLTRLTCQPSILEGGKLRDYQMDGLNWMISLYETGINGILADEMGLGKTIQTISFLAFLREYKRVSNYHLILMPKSVVGNWMREFKLWCPQIRVCNLIARKEAREQIIKQELQPGNFDVCITTFEAVRLCLGPLMKFKWEYIIIDEAHKIKNEDSQTSKRIRQMHSNYRLLLTGTPLQNNLHELWSLLNFLLPELFASSQDFDEWFDLKKGSENTLTDQEIEEKNSDMIKKLHRILRPFLLRRIKRDVEKSLLPKLEMHINVGITEIQKQIYRQLLKKSTIEKGQSTSHYKNILIQLRKVCNHPYLFHGVEPEGSPELGDHLFQVSGKMQFLDKLLLKCRVDNSQTLIFSGFTSMLDILEDYCRYREFPYCRLDGNTDLDLRQSQIDDFTSPDTDKFIFLISTRAGGLGLNLMTANTVVLYDSDWNPQQDLQAMDRAHRIGQKKQVRVYRLITKDTMEVKMIEKTQMKLKLDSMIIQKGRAAPKNSGFAKDDYKDIMNYGADAIFTIGDNMDDLDLEKLIEEGEKKAKTLSTQLDDKMKKKFDMVNFDLNECNLYEFEDVDYLKEKRKEQEEIIKQNVIALLDQETAENTRRKNKKSLAENNLTVKFYSNGQVGVSADAKKKRLARVTDFRFFPDPNRLKELIELEMEAKYNGFLSGVDPDKIFSPAMQTEKEFIESKGFPNWERREYQKFLQALENFATDDYKNISRFMDGSKTQQEVEAYARVFFQKMKTLNEWQKIKAKIEKAQKNVAFNMNAPLLIRNKLEQYSNPLDYIHLQFANQKSKFFCKESDVILLMLTDRFGYGNWTDIKRALRREQRCRLDHLFISRSEEDLKKRVVYLVQSIEKESEQKSSKPIKTAQNNEEDGEQDLFVSDKNFFIVEQEIKKLVQESERLMQNQFQKLDIKQTTKEETQVLEEQESEEEITKMQEQNEIEISSKQSQKSELLTNSDFDKETPVNELPVTKQNKKSKKQLQLEEKSIESEIRVGRLGKKSDEHMSGQDEDGKSSDEQLLREVVSDSSKDDRLVGTKRNNLQARNQHKSPLKKQLKK